MMYDLKPYPAYKDSGVPWLGEVPEHWAVGTLRRRLRRYDGIKIGPFGSQLKLDQLSTSGYKVYGQANVIGADFAFGTKFVDKQKFDEFSTYEVRSGDLLVTMMGSSGHCTQVPDGAAIGIMDSHLLRLRTDASIDRGFAALVIDRAPYVKEQIIVAGKGSIMHGLNSSMVKDLVLVLPSLAEQSAIVRFLDHVDRRIRRYIRAKQKLIGLLNEQKQAVIHCTVTRGLDPNVRLKPSGVEWLGEIPEHWEILPAFAAYKPKLIKNTGMVEKTVLSLSYGRIIIKPQEKLHGLVPESFETYQVVAPGDIILRTTDLQNDQTSLRVGYSKYRGIITAAYMCLETKGQLLNEFGYQLLNAYDLLKVFYGFGSGLRQNLDFSHIKHMPVLVPPQGEQSAIVHFLDQATTKLDRAIDAAQHEISLLREYRTRLIADMVTGKLDVREVAARLPEEAEEPGPRDEAETLDETEALEEGEAEESTEPDDAAEGVES